MTAPTWPTPGTPVRVDIPDGTAIPRFVAGIVDSAPFLDGEDWCVHLRSIVKAGFLRPLDRTDRLSRPEAGEPAAMRAFSLTVHPADPHESYAIAVSPGDSAALIGARALEVVQAHVGEPEALRSGKWQLNDVASKRRLRTSSEATATALANLRHLYQQLLLGVADQPGIARGLLGPAIETLERALGCGGPVDGEGGAK